MGSFKASKHDFYHHSLVPKSGTNTEERLRKCVERSSLQPTATSAISKPIQGSLSAPHTWRCFSCMGLLVFYVVNLNTLGRWKATQKETVFTLTNLQGNQIYLIHLEHLWEKGQDPGKHWSRRPGLLQCSLLLWEGKHCRCLFEKMVLRKKMKTSMNECLSFCLVLAVKQF